MENRKRSVQIATDGDVADDTTQEIGGKRVKAEQEQRQDNNVIQFTETQPHSPDVASSAGGSPDYLEEALNGETGDSFLPILPPEISLSGGYTNVNQTTLVHDKDLSLEIGVFCRDCDRSRPDPTLHDRSILNHNTRHLCYTIGFASSHNNFNKSTRIENAIFSPIWDHSLPRQWSLVSDQMLKPTPGDILDILARYAFPDRSISGVTSMLRDYTSVFWKLGRLYCSISSPPLKDFVTLTVDGTLFDELNLGMICTIIYHWLDCHILGLTLSHLQSKAMQFQTERESHVVDEVLITDPYSVGPRRVWDFYYNRVIPYYLLNKHMPDEWHNSTPGIQFVAISHSWVPSNDRISCYTPINHHAWPVPLPRGVDLENIRAEVKALYPEVRYCWLDVLCLRQEDTLAVPNQPSEAGIRGNRGNWLQALYLDKDYASGVIRGAELRIDVPTIGNIYLQAHGVIRYFNGLGRRFQGSNFNDPTHWLNRAWTLQEAVPNSVPGGVRDVIGNYKNAKGTRGGVTKRLREFLEEVEAAAGGKSVISLAHEMGTRHTMNAMDKIAGLSFILRFKQLPVYFGNEPIATAWDRCLSAMPAKYLEEIFINCPIIDQPRWVPSWDSLLTCCPSFIHNVDLYDKDRLRPKSPAPDRDPRAQGRAIYLEVCFTEVAYLDHVAELDYQASTRLGLQYNFFVSHEGDITIQGLGSYEEYYLATPRKRRVSPPAVEGHSLWIVLGGIAMTELGQQYRKSRKLGVLRTDEKIDQLQFRSGYIEAYLNSGNIYLFEGSAYSFL